MKKTIGLSSNCCEWLFKKIANKPASWIMFIAVLIFSLVVMFTTESEGVTHFVSTKVLYIDLLFVCFMTSIIGFFGYSEVIQLEHEDWCHKVVSGIFGLVGLVASCGFSLGLIALCKSESIFANMHMIAIPIVLYLGVGYLTGKQARYTSAKSLRKV